MLRRTLMLVAVAAVASIASVAILVIANPAPPTTAVVGESDDSRPYVIKLHARWCPLCMMTKDVWRTLEASYGANVRLVVFDFTTDTTTEMSRRRAGALGLTPVFDEYVGETGTVLVVDGRTKEVKQSLHGDLALSEYSAAIDAVLAAAVSR